MNQISFVIGRFQPFHIGHKQLVDKALLNGKRVVVFIGSSDKSRTESNPFTAEERMNIISSCFEDKELRRIVFVALPDFDTDKEWLDHIVSSLVLIRQDSSTFTFVCSAKDPSTALINSLVSQLSCVDTYTTHPYQKVNATDIRSLLKENKLLCNIPGLNKETFMKLGEYRKLINWHVEEDV